MAERTNPHAEIVVGAQNDASPVFKQVAADAQAMGDKVAAGADKAGGVVLWG